MVASPNISLATSLARLAPMRTLISEIPKASLIMFETRCKPVLAWSRPLTCENKTQLARCYNQGESIKFLTLLIEFTS